ncbi:MAG: hypothetical protein ACYDGS_01690 [Thermoleophilia bacterium]
MPQDHDFPNLQAAAARLGARRDLSLADLRELLCHDCAFWHDEHEDDLECSCFKMLHVIVQRGVLTPEQLAEALGSEETGSEE